MEFTTDDTHREMTGNRWDYVRRTEGMLQLWQRACASDTTWKNRTSVGHSKGHFQCQFLHKHLSMYRLIIIEY